LQSALRVKPKFSPPEQKLIKNRRSIPYNPGLQKLVAQKQAWAEPGSQNNEERAFQGWHQRGYLPHRDKSGLMQFITIRLQDSLPSSRRSEWESLLKIENVRERRKQLESYLDRGAGECWLGRPKIASCAEDALRFFDRQRYQLHAWVIMPNHIHVLAEIGSTPLAKLMQSWKRFIAREANKLLGREGAFWQRKYWDTYMRDSNQISKAIKYIESNPVKANIVRETRDWAWSSARFRDLNGALILPGSGDL
jgi:REP element-mobilizing transposase RayT